MSKRIASSAGFTLIELLVGMVIVTSIIVGVGVLFQKQAENSIAHTETTDLQASVQAAANMIMQDIIMAGFGGVNPQIFAHTNVAGTAPGGDTLTIFSAAKNGSAISSFVYAGAVGAKANPIYVRCFGVDGHGGIVDPSQDVVITGSETLLLYFVNPFKGELLTGITNPQTVSKTSYNADKTCLTNQAYDFDNQGDNDPVIELELSPGLESTVPRGTTVYAFRGTSPQTTYSLDYPNRQLLRDGVPVLMGVEDFQVQFRLTNQTVWLNSLAAVDTKQIAEVAFAMSVTGGTSTAMGRDYRTSVTLFDHTLDVSGAATGSRQRHEFRVRPKNAIN